MAKNDVPAGANAPKTKGEWIEITDPDGPQRDMFVQSRDVYEEVFDRSQAEDWEHFADYLRDTQRFLEKRNHRINDLAEDEPLDHYFVGVYDGEVQGVAFLTTYPCVGLGFISYFGVRKFSARGRLSTQAIADLTGVIRREAEYMLFEVEALDRRRGGDKDYINTRIKTLKNFQRSGARKFVWVDYLQPKLDPRRQTPELETLCLMMVPTARNAPPWVRSYLPREDVARYIDFVYNRLYYDGFVATEEDPRRAEECRIYLQALSDRVTAGLPAEVAQVPIIPLGLHKDDRPLARLMISYATDDRMQLTETEAAAGSEGSRAAELVGAFLNDIGVATTVFERDYRREAGKLIGKVMEEWVEANDMVLFIFTPKILSSEGVRKEITLSRRLDKPSIILVREDVGEEEEKALRGMVERHFGNVVTVPFSEENLGEVLVTIKPRLKELLSLS